MPQDAAALLVFDELLLLLLLLHCEQVLLYSLWLWARLHGPVVGLTAEDLAAIEAAVPKPQAIGDRYDEMSMALTYLGRM